MKTIIKAADKGNSVVILDKTYYKTKTKEILKDETNYKLINTNINNIISKTAKFCKIHNKSLTKKRNRLLNKLYPQNYLSTHKLRCPWCNCHRRRKWTRRHEFKSWTRLIVFHIALIPLGKVWIQLFSFQLWVNSRTDWVLQLCWGN